MNYETTLDELREFHRRCTYSVIQVLLKGEAIPNGWWLYSEDGRPGTDRLHADDLNLFFCDQDKTPEGVVIALSQLASSYLVNGGAVRTLLAQAGRPLPRAIILIAPPQELIEGEFVKTFVLTEHQVFLADSPVKEGGKAVHLADLVLIPASLTHNQRPSALN